MSAWEEEQGQLLQQNLNLLKSSSLPSLVDLGCTSLPLDYFLERREEFYHLPVPVVDRLMLRRQELMTLKYFPLLVKPGSRSVLVPCYPPKAHRDRRGPEKGINRIMNLVKEHCAGSLETFGLCRPDPPIYKRCESFTYENEQNYIYEKKVKIKTIVLKPNLETLHEILRTQSDLKELRLICNVTRETLSILADTCHQLRSLSFNECPDLDLDTVRRLAEGCPLLRKIDCSKLEDSALFNYAVQNFKNLVRISPALSPKNPPKFLHTGEPISPQYRPNVEHTSPFPFPDLPLICANLPNVHSLEVHADNLDKCEFQSVQKLKVIDIASPQHISTVEKFLARCGGQIEVLKLKAYRNYERVQSTTVLDLTTVYHHCPNLIELETKDLKFATTCQHQITEQNVQHLRSLSIYDLLRMQRSTPPDGALLPVICNGVLEHFEVHTLESALVARLTDEMREAVVESRPSPVFPKLTSMAVHWMDYEFLSRINMKQAISLVTLAPKLQVFQSEVMFEQHIELVKRFMEKYGSLSSYIRR